jgi:hypothetical protein
MCKIDLNRFEELDSLFFLAMFIKKIRLIQLYIFYVFLVLMKDANTKSFLAPLDACLKKNKRLTHGFTVFVRAHLLCLCMCERLRLSRHCIGYRSLIILYCVGKNIIFGLKSYHKLLKISLPLFWMW